MSSRTKFLLLTSVAVIAFGPECLAAETLNEVTVIARKRTEVSRDVPIAISTFTSQDIQSAGIERPADFINLTPNVSLVQTQNQGNSFVVDPRHLPGAQQRALGRGGHRRRAHGPARGVQSGSLRYRQHRSAQGPAGRPLRPQRDRRRDHHPDQAADATNSRARPRSGFENGSGVQDRAPASAARSAIRSSSAAPCRSSTPRATSRTPISTTRPIRSRTCPDACKLLWEPNEQPAPSTSRINFSRHGHQGALLQHRIRRERHQPAGPGEQSGQEHPAYLRFVR